MNAEVPPTVPIEALEAGQRLDVFCVGRFPEYTRGTIQRAIKAGVITVSGKRSKPSYVLRTGDVVAFTASVLEQQAQATAPQPLPPLPIIHEDKDIVVINKPAGVTVHPGQGVASGTVADWFAARYPNAQVGDAGRLGIVHRLDQETSGVLVLAKTPAAFERLKDQFKHHRVRKEYLALVFGTPGESKGRITRPLARSKRNPLRRTVDAEGKPAVTEWEIEEKLGEYTLLRVFPLTGRTHQIRVHLHFLGFPIIGDKFYVFKRKRPPQGVTRHLLHAEKLTFVTQAGKRKTFTAPLPEDFVKVLDQLRKK
ncbi:MAG: RluA family pseudouridine synthase [Candidatus Andersenbacteria bacterium]